jgi:hypothetical protein
MIKQHALKQHINVVAEDEKILSRTNNESLRATAQRQKALPTET